MDILSAKQKFGIIGNNAKLNNAIEIALKVAPTDLTVLVSGESGVGKEFFPQIIHSYSTRKHNNYIAVNCGAIPEGTIDSELFGHEKGSFTGATDNRKGYFEMADGGTIFLDEVAELPLQTQVRLLRVLQTGEYIRVGSSKVQKTNVRVVAATNVELPSIVSKGGFREDLYYRLNTVPVFIPSLRNRKEDIHLLFRKFCSDIADKYSMPIIKLDESARGLLENYRWPGNIRQLKNIAEQMSVIEQSRDINTTIIEKYLPDILSQNTPMIYKADEKSQYEEFGTEREILYKVLFDLRSDILELREMVVKLQSTSSTSSSDMLPSVIQPEIPTISIEQSNSIENDRFDSAVEVDDNELSEKQRFQKEQIMKSLDRNKGKRRDVANELFISERTLYRRIKELGIDE